MGSKRKSVDDVAVGDQKQKKAKKKDKKASKKDDVDREPTCAASSTQGKSLPFDYRFIMAPMVGASELPFRILCRKYGAQLCYTPMMIASQFAESDEYFRKEFQTTPFDRPLVCHFAANNPDEFAKAIRKARPYCDAIDLNLGCPQVRSPMHLPQSTMPGSSPELTKSSRRHRGQPTLDISEAICWTKKTEIWSWTL